MSKEMKNGPSKGDRLLGTAKIANVIPGPEDTIVQWEVSPQRPGDERLLEKALTEATGGTKLEEIPLGDSTSGKNFSTGFGGNHPKKATWEPSGGAWKQGSAKVQ